MEYTDATLDQWVAKVRRRALAVFQTAVKYTVLEVQDRTPVDTGFLRASFTVTFDKPLPGREKRPPGSKKNQYSVDPGFTLTINQAQFGQVLYASFVANYAPYVEYGANGRPPVGMVRLSAQNWQMNVDKATQEAKARIRR